MVSEMKRAANARNAMKSTGPRTKEGKKRSSMNAVTHALTAHLAILPDENKELFEYRMDEWKRIFGPRNGFEEHQVEKLVYLSWQLQRSWRAQSARLVFLAETADDDKWRKHELEVDELMVRLFRKPAAARTDGPQSERQGSDPHTSSPDSFDGPDHPAVLAGRLETYWMGCDSLRAHWTELAAIIETGGVWKAAERFKAVRLLGSHPSDVIVAPGLIDLLLACQALDPQAGDLVEQMVPGALAATRDEWKDQPDDVSPPMEESAARRVLLTIANAELERLSDLVEEHRNRAEFEQALAPHQLAFDHTPDGERMRRYETTSNNLFNRLYKEVDKKKAKTPIDRSGFSYLDYRSERPDLEARVLAAMASTRKISKSKPDDSSASCEIPRSPAPVVHRSTTSGAPLAPSEPPLRNEPTAPGGQDLCAKSQSAGELKSQPPTTHHMTSERKSEPVAALKQVLRNEPTGSTFQGMHLSDGLKPAGGGSRRDRRARQARERANGVRKMESGLNVTGTRKSLSSALS
jgi:hypothetical protein